MHDDTLSRLLETGKISLDELDRRLHEGETAVDILGAVAPNTPMSLDRFHVRNRNGEISGVYDFEIFKFVTHYERMFVLGGIPYFYTNGAYIPDTTGAVLKTKIRNLILPKFVKSTTIRRIYDLFTSAAELQKSFEDLNQYPAHWICFQDGMLDPITGEMYCHDPNYFCVNQVPHDYATLHTANGEHVERWLDFIAPDPDSREMLLQFCGYCLTRDTRQQKFLILTGEGGSGKSTLIRMLEAAVGEKNVSNIALNELGQRFSSYGLLGKLLNSCADLEVSALTDVSLLKKILGEDSLRGEQKGRDAVSFKSYAKLIFSTNELPIVKGEKTSGFYRRLLVLPMNRVTEHKRADFFDELRSELPYFIRLSVEALGRMLRLGAITESRESAEAVERLRCDSDTVQAWLLEQGEKMLTARTERSAVFADYELYCDDAGRTPLSKNGFFKSLRLKGYREIKSCGIRCFEGTFQKKTALKSALNCPEKCPSVEDEPFL